MLKAYVDSLHRSGIRDIFLPQPDPIAVTWEGNEASPFIVVGPRGSDEGQALFDKMLSAMKESRESVRFAWYNTDASMVDETLTAALKGSDAKIVLALGEGGLRAVMAFDHAFDTVRKGRYRLGGATLMASYHPDQLVTDASLKRPAWEDLQQVMKVLGTS